MIHIVLLGVWVGAGVFLLGVANPDAIAVLSRREDAASFIAAALSRLDLFGVIAGPIVLITLFLGWLPLGVKLRFRAAAAVVLTGLAAASRYWLGPRMAELRKAMGRPLDDIDLRDPLVYQLSTLSTTTLWLVGLQITLALVILVAAVVSTNQRRSFGVEL